MQFSSIFLSVAAFVLAVNAAPAPVDDAQVAAANVVVKGQPFPPFGYVNHLLNKSALGRSRNTWLLIRVCPLPATRRLKKYHVHS